MDGRRPREQVHRTLHGRQVVAPRIDQRLPSVHEADKQEFGHRLSTVGGIQFPDLLELDDRLLPLAQVVKPAAIGVQTCQAPALGDEIRLGLGIGVAGISGEEFFQLGCGLVPVLLRDRSLGGGVLLSQRLLALSPGQAQLRLRVVGGDFQNLLESRLCPFVVAHGQACLPAIVDILDLALGGRGPWQPPLQGNQHQSGDADKRQQHDARSLPAVQTQGSPGAAAALP